MSHTPGPWKANKGYRIHAPTTDSDYRNGRVIVDYKHQDDFNYDDEALIEAAPDLLAACEAAIKHLGGRDSDTGWEDAAALCRAAIAKAKGKA